MCMAIKQRDEMADLGWGTGGGMSECVCGRILLPYIFSTWYIAKKDFTC